jgi:hypothetical protein
MSVALYIVTQQAIDGVDTSVNGKAIGRASDKSLDRVCKSIGQPSLYDFVSQDSDELRELIEDAGVDAPDTLPEEQWFHPDEGKKLVTALLKYFEENPKSMKNVTGLVEDLQEYQRVFDELALHGAKWHFEVDF